MSGIDFTDDSSMVAAGFEDGNIRVWTLTPNKLRCMKPSSELEYIDKEAGESGEVVKSRCFLDLLISFRFCNKQRYLVLLKSTLGYKTAFNI